MKMNYQLNYLTWMNLKPGPDGEGPLANLTEWKNYQRRNQEK